MQLCELLAVSRPIRPAMLPQQLRHPVAARWRPTIHRQVTMAAESGARVAVAPLQGEQRVVLIFRKRGVRRVLPVQAPHRW